MSTNISSEATATSSRRQMFLDIVRQSNISCQSGDYASAIALYSEALKIDPNNAIILSNRSAAFIKIGQFSRALQDALKVRELRPDWAKAYYRQGIAHNCLRQHPEALGAFSSGLAVDPKSSQLLSGLIEAALKSPLKGKIQPTLDQLTTMKLQKSAFVVISVIGQELLAGGYYAASVVVLESALKIGTTNIKLKGSVISALSSAYWALNSLEKAISYMQQDLAVAKSLNDVAGECRAYGNLGSAYFSKANYKEALTSHRMELVLAMKCKDSRAAASALTNLGHVYTAIGDYSNALASHKRNIAIVKQMGDLLQEAREIGNVGAVYLVMGNFDHAIDCHMEALRLAKQLGNKVEEARAYSNLGSSYHYRRNFSEAITFHNYVLKIGEELGDKNIEARAYAGLGHAARCMGNYGLAKMYHEKQLEQALSTKDKVLEGKSCSNLGIVYQLLNDHDAALKLHQAHLNIAIATNDRAGMGRAYGNIGNAYSSMSLFEQAIKFHKQELILSKEVNDRSSEASTHGNLAVAYQALRMFEKALVHYHSHLNISRELKDTSGEACALLNLGNCHSTQGSFSLAVPFYENYLMLSQELGDVEGEAKACHFLGYAHYSLGNYKEAVRFYNQDLVLAKDLQNKTNIARALCNIGLTHLSLNNLDQALECQKLFLAVAHSMKNVTSIFRALGNIGTILLKTKKPEDAVKIYQKQVMLAKSTWVLGSMGSMGAKSLEANAYNSLGMAHRVIKRFDQALGFHTQQLTILQEINDSRGECSALGNIGAVHMALGNYTCAINCYGEMLERAKELKDGVGEAHAYANLAICRMHSGNYQEAIHLFQQQLTVLESIFVSMSQSGSSSSNSGILSSSMFEKGRAFANLGDCFSAVSEHEQAIHFYERSLQISSTAQNPRELEKTYRGIGVSSKSIGNFSQAVKYLEKRLLLLLSMSASSSSSSVPNNSGQSSSSCSGDSVTGSTTSNSNSTATSSSTITTHSNNNNNNDNNNNSDDLLSSSIATANNNNNNVNNMNSTELLTLRSGAYEDLGLVHLDMRNFDQAINCFEQSQNIAKDLEDRHMESGAVANIGKCFHVMGEHQNALKYFHQDLEISQDIGNLAGRSRAYINIGLTHESMQNFEQALRCLEQHLNLSGQVSPVEGGGGGVGGGGDGLVKAVACSSIGRVHYALGNNIQAVAYLQQGLQIMEKINDFKAKEEEAKIRHFLGLAMWIHGDVESAQAHLEKSTNLLEMIRHNVGSSEYSLALFDRQIASYQALQRILVPIGRTDLTLLVAEKSRTLANISLQFSHQNHNNSNNNNNNHFNNFFSSSSSTSSSSNNTLPNNNNIMGSSSSSSLLLNTVDYLIERVNRLRAAVLYYSIAGNYLYAWLLVPGRGIVKFHETCLNNNDNDTDETEEEDDEDEPANMGSLLEKYIRGTRDAMGIDFNVGGSGGVGSGSCKSLTDSNCVDNSGNLNENGNLDLWSQHLEELGDKLNQDNDKTGFLRMVSRNHRFNCSSYSLSSLFSVGSATGSVKSTPTSRPGSTRSRNRSNWQEPSMSLLYQMLIAPFQDELAVLHQTCFRELVLVLDTDLLLVPFPILRNSTNDEYFCEKFKLIVAPSISSIKVNGSHHNSHHHHRNHHHHQTDTKNSGDMPGSPLVIGNPKLTPEVVEQWGWEEVSGAESEANMVAEIFQCQPLVGSKANKENVLQRLCSAECIHFATHVSWKLSAIVLSPSTTNFQDHKSLNGTSNNNNTTSSSSSSSNSRHGNHDGDDNMDMENNSDQDNQVLLSEYLLTAADILKLRLNAKLVVLSACHTKDKHRLANADSVVAMSKALLAAGAMAVIITLWPVPDTASKIFFRTLYSSLLQGAQVSHAVTEAMLTVQHTKHFGHPANWSGYLLIANDDVYLSNKGQLTSQALWELLKCPDRCRDALRVTLHLVEKSLQRINNGQNNAMYTTQKSIENKVGNACGWKEILMSVGFKFSGAQSTPNGLPAAVFFPQTDPGERLVRCSASLQALLGLLPPSIHALSKLLSTPEAGKDMISILRQAIAEMAIKNVETDKAVEVKINVKLWGVNGCHELLASLGFDLIEVGENEVILGVGKHVNSRMLQLALQAALVLFDSPMEVAEKTGSTFSRSISLESLELTSEELCPMTTSSMQTVSYLPVRQQIAMGKGAFTSYVRSRGEPDGHTNMSMSDICRDHHGDLELHFVSSNNNHNNAGTKPSSKTTTSSSNNNSNGQQQVASASSKNIPPSYRSGGNGGPPPLPSLRNSYHGNGLVVQRADSSSSGSSMTDWENGLSTVRRAPPPLPNGHPDPLFAMAMKNKLSVSNSLSGFDSQGSDSDFGMMMPPVSLRTSGGGGSKSNKKSSFDLPLNSEKSSSGGNSSSSNSSTTQKRVTWKINEMKAAAAAAAARNNSSSTSSSGAVAGVGGGAESNNKPWLKVRNVFPGKSHTSGGSSQEVKDIVVGGMQQISRTDLPLTEVYHERNLGLGLAPPLSKLLMTNRLNLSQIEAATNSHSDCKSDTEGGAMSMDDTMSFDQLSLAEDSCAESTTSKAYPPVPRKRSTINNNNNSSRTTLTIAQDGSSSNNNGGTSNISTVAVTVNNNSGGNSNNNSSKNPTNLSINLSNLSSVGGSSSSSSKSSPSDLSRRDEGDGRSLRSLTDSQYGSYSPSMAQNLIQTAAAVYYASRDGKDDVVSSGVNSNNNNNNNNINNNNQSVTTIKGNIGQNNTAAAAVAAMSDINSNTTTVTMTTTTTNNNNSSSSVLTLDNNKSLGGGGGGSMNFLKSGKTKGITHVMVNAIELRSREREKSSSDKMVSRAAKHSPIRNGGPSLKLPINLATYGQKSSEC